MRSTNFDTVDYDEYFGSEDAERRRMEKELREEAEIDAYIEKYGSRPGRQEDGDE